MVINPFRDLVGLRSVDASALIWVNDLPGLSTELVADLAQASDLFGAAADKPALAVWDSVHRNAIDRLASEMLICLSEKYDYQPVIARTIEPEMIVLGSTSSPADVWVGSLLGTAYKPHSALTVRSVQFGVTDLTVEECTIKIVDLNTKSELYSHSHPITLGSNTINLPCLAAPMSFLSGINLAVMLQTSGFELIELAPTQWDVLDCDRISDYTVKSFFSTSALPTIVTPLPLDNFLHVEVELTRSLDALLTRHTTDLQTAYAYLCGSLLMTEKLASPNLSVFTLSNLQFSERAETKLMDDFKRAIRPVARRLSDDLLRQRALNVPTPTPDEPRIIYGSYV